MLQLIYAKIELLSDASSSAVGVRYNKFNHSSKINRKPILMKQSKANCSKAYQYNWKIVCLTLWHFMKIHKQSRLNFIQYRDFCLNYPRKSDHTNPEQPIVVNNYQTHIADLQAKQMSPITFTEAQIEQFILEQNELKISCLKILHPDSKKWVIGMHGWTEDKYLALRQVWHYWQAGYNVLTFDSFAHGDSSGTYTDIGMSSLTMSDVVVDYLHNVCEATVIGMIGNSMGASSAIWFAQHGINKHLVNWIVADCGFNAIKLQYRYFIQHNMFDDMWWKVGLGFTRKFSKITKTKQHKFNLMSHMHKASTTPIFFIHSLSDTFVPAFMSQEMYARKIKSEQTPLSQIWTPDQCNHVMVLPNLNQAYVAKTLAFANKHEPN